MPTRTPTTSTPPAAPITAGHPSAYPLNGIWTAGECTICHTPFISPHFSDKTCSPTCRRAHRRHMERLQETRRWQRLLARDNYTCQLCGDPVDPTHPDPQLRPNADHKIPKAAGGGRTQDNLQVTHRLCNTLKGKETGKKAHVAVVRGRARYAARAARRKADGT